jgi:hypothetical protein
VFYAVSSCWHRDCSMIKAEGDKMETIIEIVHHTEHLKPAVRVELLSYIMLMSITVLLGVVHAVLKRP